MIGDALTAVNGPASSDGNGDGDGGSTTRQSDMELADFVQLQSKTLVSIMDVKVAAAEERARRLAAEHLQERKAVNGRVCPLSKRHGRWS